MAAPAGSSFLDAIGPQFSSLPLDATDSSDLFRSEHSRFREFH